MSPASSSARTVWSALRTAGDALASVVIPAPCRICAALLDTASRIPVCANCLETFRPLQPPLCLCCGHPFISPLAAQAREPLCRLCRAQTFGFDAARSFALYQGSLVRSILLLKHSGVAPLGRWFAGRLEELIAADPGLFEADAVVPVPLYPRRRRERGYNQAELIAKPLAKVLGLPLRASWLARTRPRPDVLRMSRAQRWKSVRGAYSMHRGVRVDKARILLVDDVMTTGATLDACSRVLRRAGAARVVALTVARSVPHWAPADAPPVPPGVNQI
ncbi:MAG: ComF family protein [Bryobacteraceae bacterium]